MKIPKTNLPDRKEVIANLLQRSFDQNKSVNYVIKQDRKRQKRIRHLMMYSYEICQAFGEVILNEDQSACALILLPQNKKSNIFSITQDLQLITKAFGIANVPKVLKREALIKQHHPEGNFCYLWFIGVDPAQQRQGKGSYLLNQIIEKYHGLGLDIYLETSTVTNVPWYEKMGFENYQELDFGFPFYMLRKRLVEG